MVGFDGKVIQPFLADFLREGPPGGVILFERNIGLPEEIRELTASLQKSALQSGAQIPLLVAVDQEGGQVRRFRQAVPALPSARKVAQSLTPQEAERLAYRTGLALRSLGVNMNLAPVVDLVGDSHSFLYSRTYGSSPEVVSRYSLATISGYAASGVITSAKHFPGHGSAPGDTHAGQVRSRLSRKALEPHLAPFATAIAAGVPTVMISHVTVDAFDPIRPASLSASVATDLLRGDLGFKGVAISDDLEMLAVLQGRAVGETTVQALGAGVDLLLLGGGAAQQQEARTAIVRAVQEGKLSSERLDEAVLRILALKEEFGGSLVPQPLEQHLQ